MNKLEDKFKLTNLNQLRRDETKPFGRLIVDTRSLVERSVRYADDEKRMTTFNKCDIVAYANLYNISPVEAYQNVNLIRNMNNLDNLLIPGIDDNYYVTGDKE
jgi:hypothetical protein